MRLKYLIEFKKKKTFWKAKTLKKKKKEYLKDLQKEDQNEIRANINKNNRAYKKDNN